MKKRVVIIVPLIEELKVFFQVFKRTQSHPLRAPGLGYWNLSGMHSDLETFVTALEEMGNEPALVTAIDCINQLQPNLLICAGIGGSLTNDLLLGDVAVARSVKGISDCSKIVDRGAKGVELHLSDRGFRPADELVEQCAQLAISWPEGFKSWQDQCALHMKDTLRLEPSTALSTSGTAAPAHIARPRPELKSTDFASGFVVAADNFHIRSTSRETGIVETEGAGIGRACQRRGRKVPFLILRGVSDFADSRKTLLEAMSKDAWRDYAKYSVYSFVQTILTHEHFVSAVEQHQPIPSKCAAPELTAPRVDGRFAVLMFILDTANRLMLVHHPFHKRLIPPGGRLNDGEIPHEAVKRRLLEETGISAFDFHPDFHRPLRVISERVEDVPGPYSVHMEHRRQRDDVMFHYAFVYVCQFTGGNINKPSNSSYQPQWYTLEEVKALPRDMIPFDDIIRRYEDILDRLSRRQQATHP